MYCIITTQTVLNRTDLPSRKTLINSLASYPTSDQQVYCTYMYNMTPVRIQAHCVQVMEEFLEDISYLEYSVKVKGVALRTNYGSFMRIKMYTK